MSLSAYDVSVALFVRGLTNLKSSLAKGEAHAAAHAIDPSELLDARLAHDMFTLAVQVHWAAEGARLGAGRLVGVTSPPGADAGKTFAALHEEIDAAIAYLRTLDPGGIEAGLDRSIVLPRRGGSTTLTGRAFLEQFAIPNFFFHATTAYGILRHKGVPVDKGDFMGTLG